MYASRARQHSAQMLFGVGCIGIACRLGKRHLSGASNAHPPPEDTSQGRLRAGSRMAACNFPRVWSKRSPSVYFRAPAGFFAALAGAPGGAGRLFRTNFKRAHAPFGVPERRRSTHSATFLTIGVRNCGYWPARRRGALWGRPSTTFRLLRGLQPSRRALGAAA